MIRLDGGFELDEYWREVRQTGNDRLEEFGFNDWVVTLRPLAVPDFDIVEARDEEPIANPATKTIDIAVEKQPELPPESFVQTSIIDVIEQATHAQHEDDDEDFVRDTGGEA